MCVVSKNQRWLKRTALAMSLAAITTGCQQTRTAQNFPPPPGLMSGQQPDYSAQSTSIANGNANTFGNPTPSTTIAARPAQIPDAPLNSSPNGFGQQTAPSSQADTMIVRGQDGGGFIMPPLPEVTADGGRHSRDPLPVSGHRTTVAQTNVAQTSVAQTSVAQAQGFDDLPPPPPGVPTTNSNAGTGYPYTPSNPPSVSQPLVSPNGPSVPYSANQPGYGGQPGFGMQPGYDTLPQISAEELTVNTAQPVGIPYEPTTRIADIIVNGYPARTGRIMFGGAVNSDAGVTGQVTIEERNFDITRWPKSFQDLVSGTAFRGAGQTLRIEAVPGSQFQRYSVNFTEPFLFGYMPISATTSAFLFDRRYQDWYEERMGGRLNFGYRITPDLSISAGIRAEQVDVYNPRVGGIPQLDAVLGENDIYSGQFRLTHDTRNSPFAPSEGHYMEFSYEQAFGDFDFPRFEASYNRYFLVRERADGSGRQTFTTGLNVGVSGEDTPIFENYFAGGYTTLRGFRFRGASPTVGGVQVGGRFQMLGTFEYMFPLTADDMLRAVAFVDYGTVEDDVRLDRDTFRVSPGFGLRIAVPALGPAPLAFDFAFPVMDADGDDKQVFSFYMGLTRKL